MLAYLLLKFVLELDELVEELCVDVLDALNRLIMDLSLHVFLRDLLPKLIRPVHALEPLAFLQR